MNTQYDLAIESFIMNFDGSIMNDMIAEEGLKDAMIKVKNAILAAIRWIVDKCKLLFRKITGKDKKVVNDVMKETQKIQKVVEKTNNPQVLSQAQEKVKEQKEKLEEVTGGGDVAIDNLDPASVKKYSNHIIKEMTYISKALKSIKFPTAENFNAIDIEKKIINIGNVVTSVHRRSNDLIAYVFAEAMGIPIRLYWNNEENGPNEIIKIFNTLDSLYLDIKSSISKVYELNDILNNADVNYAKIRLLYLTIPTSAESILRDCLSVKDRFNPDYLKNPV